MKFDYRKICGIAGVALLASIAGFVGYKAPVEVATPWQSIGGCGAGGSGGGSGDGIKWIGQGVSGGYLEVEAFTKYAVGQNFSSMTFTPHLSVKPTWSTKLGVSIPMMSHQGEVQYRSNQNPTDRTTGGLGDVSFDFSKTIGSGGAASLSASLSIPTGQYDIKRGTDGGKEILPSSFQKGSGLYSLTLGWDYSRDTDKGIWLYGLTYTHPFAMHLFSGENEFNDSYWKDLDHKGDRFKYRFKAYGENDLGAYTPPSVGGSIAYGYRGRPGIVQSFGLSFSAPLGVAWISSETEGKYDPRPDPDHKAWSAALAYGIEFSDTDFPVYFAVSIPIHDKSNSNSKDEYDEKPMRQWDAPDWSDFGQQWTVAVGVKGSFF
ncbi:hypothetical protein [Fibrobacter sp. UWEL]|uniref:hypothetical protein n=1 Tax=Fibrobacter sp. UWEL TaxID=1896209 RepID=UPI0009131266|nr:hypothetical protein [Fibrobacter sp. UWEL]SHK55635.1 hypothetical protein SAMN05720468_103107 [Fibrobacter sp. UWEL]